MTSFFPATPMFSAACGFNPNQPPHFSGGGGLVPYEDDDALDVYAPSSGEINHRPRYVFDDMYDFIDGKIHVDDLDEAGLKEALKPCYDGMFASSGRWPPNAWNHERFYAEYGDERYGALFRRFVHYSMIIGFSRDYDALLKEERGDAADALLRSALKDHYEWISSRIICDFFKNEGFLEENPRTSRQILHFYEAITRLQGNPFVLGAGSGFYDASNDQQDQNVNDPPAPRGSGIRYGETSFNRLGKRQRMEKAVDMINHVIGQVKKVSVDKLSDQDRALLLALPALPEDPKKVDAHALKKMYRRIARRVHPDINPVRDYDAMEPLFKQLAEAYSYLAEDLKKKS